MAEFTPEEVQEILDAFFETMGTRQYIGARYVPIFGRKDEDSIIWDNTKPYEPLTIVLYQGNSYTSRQFVPVGVDITNLAFWANTGNYNAQVEQYRQEVATFQEGLDAQAERTTALEASLPSTDFSGTSTVKSYIDAADSALAALLPASQFSETSTVKNVLDGISALLPSDQFSESSTVKDALDLLENQDANLAALLPSGDFDSTNTVKRYVDSRIATLEASLTRNVILIGDSYLEGTHSAGPTTNGKNWGDYLTEYGSFTSVRSYANGGSGFSRDGSTAPFIGKNWADMVEIVAYDLTTTEKNEVTDLVFGGGWNDAQHWGDFSQTSHVYPAVQKARENFPNAKIHIVFMYGGTRNIQQNFYRMEQIYRQAAYHYGCSFASTMYLVKNFSTPSYDDIHPTETVQEFLGGFVCSLINNNTDGFYGIGSGMAPNDYANSTVFVQVSKYGIARVTGIGLRMPSAYSGNTVDLAKLSEAYAPTFKTQWFLGVCSQNWAICVMCIDTDGSIKLTHASNNLTQGNNLYFSTCYPLE